jgi:APA family basic amino acid/polyamine antiporter
LRTPGQVAAQLGHPAAILGFWAFGALFAFVSASSIAELAVRLPRAGGFAVYARALWGDAAGFAVGWCDSLGQIAAVAFAAVTAEELLGIRGTAVALVLGIAAVQWAGIRAASWLQNAISFSLAAAYLALVAAAFTRAPAPASSIAGAGSWIVALRAVIVAYDGWYGAIYFSEETQDQAKVLPRAMALGVSVVAAVYLAVNAALIARLGVPALAASGFPGLEAARQLFGVTGERAIWLISVLAMPSLMNAVLLLASRIAYSMGIDRVNSRGVPVGGLLLCTALALLLTLTATFDKLLAMAAFFYAVTYSTGYVAVFLMRRREGPGPYRSWAHPWGTAAALTLCLGFLAADVRQSPWDSIRALGLLAASYPVYRITRRHKGFR